MRRTIGCSVMNATIDIAPPRGTHRRWVPAYFDLDLVYEPQQFGPAALASTQRQPVSRGHRRNSRRGRSDEHHTTPPPPHAAPGT